MVNSCVRIVVSAADLIRRANPSRAALFLRAAAGGMNAASCRVVGGAYYPTSVSCPDLSSFRFNVASAVGCLGRLTTGCCLSQSTNSARYQPIAPDPSVDSASWMQWTSRKSETDQLLCFGDPEMRCAHDQCLVKPIEPKRQPSIKPKAASFRLLHRYNKDARGRATFVMRGDIRLMLTAAPDSLYGPWFAQESDFARWSKLVTCTRKRKQSTRQLESDRTSANRQDKSDTSSAGNGRPTIPPRLRYPRPPL